MMRYYSRYISALFFFFIINLNGQSNFEELPYANFNESVFNSRLQSKTDLMARMIDDLGYRYYRATDSLFNNDEKNEVYKSNLPRLLSYVIYQMSEVLSPTGDQASSMIPFEMMSYHEIRGSTLKNLNDSSTSLRDNQGIGQERISEMLIPLMVAERYLEEFKGFRNYIGRPYVEDSIAKKDEVQESVKFQRSLDADGLTTEQWIALNKYDPIIRQGWNYFNFHKLIRRRNMAALNEIIKEEKAIVRAGKTEPLKAYSGIVEGIEYNYFREKPKQVSFLFSPDKELIKQLVDWVIFINAGNPTKLSDIFKMGLGATFFRNEDQVQLSFDFIDYRNITDDKGDTIILTYSKKYYNGVDFSETIVDKVFVTRENRIVFSSKTKNEESNKITIQLINVEGTLLKRIKSIIELMRTNENKYDPTSLNLIKF